MSLGRVLLLGTAALGGTYALMKPEARQQVKKVVAKNLRRISNSLDPAGPPPMWTDEPETTEEPVFTQQDVPVAPEVEQEQEEPLDDETRTIHGFKVKN